MTKLNEYLNTTHLPLNICIKFSENLVREYYERYRLKNSIMTAPMLTQSYIESKGFDIHNKSCPLFEIPEYLRYRFSWYLRNDKDLTKISRKAFKRVDYNERILQM